MEDPKKNVEIGSPYELNKPLLFRNNPSWWKRLLTMRCMLTAIVFGAILSCIIFAINFGIILRHKRNNDVTFPRFLNGLFIQIDQYFIEQTDKDTCLTPGCIHAASSVLKTMDPSVEPCDNFYKFVCGNFLNSTIIADDKSSVDTFTDINDKLNEQLRMSFEETNKTNEPKPFRLVKNLYKSCINKEAIEAEGLKPLHKILKKLGGWPVIDEDLWNENDFDWKILMYKFSEIGHSINFPFKFTVSIDPKNGTRHVIVIDQPSLSLPREYFLKDFKDKFIQNYYNYMIDITMIVGAQNKLRAIEELRHVLQFEIELANITVPKEKRRDANQLYNLMNLTELTKNYPSISWRQLFNKLLPSTIDVEEKEIVIVTVPQYFADVEKLIAATPKRVLANYIIWKIVGSSIGLLNEEIRKRQLVYLSTLNGRTERAPRWKECVQMVSGSLSTSVGSMYVRKYFNEDAKKNAIEMVTNIERQFITTLEQVDWLDEETRKSALDKASAMSRYIAYPDELLDDKKLEYFYENLELSESNFFDNALNISAFGAEYSFGKLRQPVDKHDWIRHAQPAVVNAFYSPIENSIQFPAGILQGSFFSNDRPKYMNYGEIGFVIGHEITHGFDDQGRRFDKDGNLVDWWAPETKENYFSRAECIINQYGNYTVEEVGLNINGVNTQGENVADNGGMKGSYHAYVSLIKEYGEEQKLPGLPYTSKQMFWISAANAWCTKYKPEIIKLRIDEDYHSPAEFRILGSLSNIPEFSKDFNCPVGSKMNPLKKCTVW